MKIAIPSEGNTLDAQIDSRFGRCAFFAIYDTDTRKTDFFPNSAKDSSEGAGPAAVKFIASKGVKTIVAAEFGGKVKPLLDKLQIEMINENGKNISKIIQQF
ncbi:MAG: NifB/NifX family molybdenum-iron cluster-binding protein [Dysgonamonadaceae bacterium]|nr:NifB/NifX family molybdenum-iron cluster-binding protein [Tissierellia bacterium]MEA5080040.1 NifB/NifX family molybdenum-iron cluster-binding protein [Dysgonamonadaceae bacterium]